jgi:hypothetical protein
LTAVGGSFTGLTAIVTVASFDGRPSSLAR